ncbi:hypothetical protein IWX49DRAFT_553302 [Phyllosticta citricarpa]
MTRRSRAFGFIPWTRLTGSSTTSRKTRSSASTPSFAKALLVMLADTRLDLPFHVSPAINVLKLINIAYQPMEEEEDTEMFDIQPEIFGVKPEEATRAMESSKDAKIRELTSENGRSKREVEDFKKRLA